MLEKCRLDVRPLCCRSWQNRGYVQKVCLLIIDEIHLLGADRFVSF